MTAVRRSASARSPRLAVALALAVLAGCGGGTAASRPAGQAPRDVARQADRAALEAYVRQVEPIRLAADRLLLRADPILRAYQRGAASSSVTARRIGALELRFAAYTAGIAAIEPATPELRSAHAGYAHTYILEDAYLSALTAGIANRDLGNLPNTQAAQRTAVIQWRTDLAVLAARTGVTLPADLVQAGRGEIAPSPRGS